MSLQVGIFRSEVVGKDETLGLPVFDRAVTEEFLEKLFFMVDQSFTNRNATKVALVERQPSWHANRQI